jgi:hypothetical protein
MSDLSDLTKNENEDNYLERCNEGLVDSVLSLRQLPLELKSVSVNMMGLGVRGHEPNSKIQKVNSHAISNRTCEVNAPRLRMSIRELEEKD